MIVAFLIGWNHGAVADGRDRSAIGLLRDAKPQRVDRLFRSFINAESPGAAVIILQKGKVLYRAAYGLADLDRASPLTPEHIFHIGSVGKQFTALAIMMLVEEGKLGYEDPLQRYLPELPAWSKKVTIRHLLHHTSGLPDYDDDLGERLFNQSERPDNLDLLAVLSTMRKLPANPGELFEYSNPGYDLLGLIIERVSRQRFSDFVQSSFFGPLDMTHSFSQPNPKRMKDPLIAHSYIETNGVIEAYDSDPMDDLVGSGSIYSTLDDMARYEQALFSNKLVKTSTLAQAFTSGELNNGETTGYGFAWEIERWNRRSYVAHSGAWLGFTSDFVHFLKEELSVIVLLNRDYDVPDAPRIGVQVAKIYLN